MRLALPSALVVFVLCAGPCMANESPLDATQAEGAPRGGIRGLAAISEAAKSHPESVIVTTIGPPAGCVDPDVGNCPKVPDGN